MSNNNLNLYVTFSECAPMLPIESFEVGVPCVFGNNHHYFKNNELEDYLLVENENNPMKIAEKILKLYQKWKKENDENSKKLVKEFLDM